MTDDKTLVKVEPDRAGYRDILAQVLLEHLTFTGRIVTIEASLGKAAEAHNDDACLKLVELLLEIYYREERAIGQPTDINPANAAERAYLRWREHLERLYWQLPDKRKTDKQYSEEAHGFIDIFGPTLVKTKLQVLNSIIRRWMPELTEESRRIFRFVINCYHPGFYATPSSKEFEGKFISQEQKGEIEKLFRGRLGAGNFSANEISLWLLEEEMPEKIRGVLVASRAWRGGWALAKRDIRNAKLLANFEPENRLPWARQLYAMLGEQVKYLDIRVHHLLTAMRATGWERAEKIGASEYIPGECEVELTRLDAVAITIRLPAQFSHELARDIAGRVQRHVENWCQEHETKWPGEPTIGNPIPQIRIWVSIYHGAQALDGIEGKT